ncbi:MAG: phosphoribosyltransferase domain-containing protein [Candidatus Nanopelagicales bacterium]
MTGLASDLLGLQVREQGGDDGLCFGELAGIGLRRNPKRPQLIVSYVLAKHVPVSGAEARLAGRRLAERIRASAEASTGAGPSAANPTQGILVVGFAETACGLAGLVSDELSGSALAHTTRDLRERQHVWLSFTEAHSHAPGHAVLENVRRLVQSSSLIVIVDDELSTGSTAWELIRELDRACPGRAYVVACLIDARSGHDASRLEARASTAGILLQVTSLVRAELSFASDAQGVVDAFLLGGGSQAVADVTDEPVERIRQLPARPLVLGDARQGLLESDRMADQIQIQEFADRARTWLSGRVLVIGTEEEMFPAIQIAALMGADVQSTTRSPAVVIDDPDYPIRSGVTFASVYDPAVPAFLYNGPASAGVARYDNVLLLLPATRSAGGDTPPAGLLAASARCTTGTVWTATVLRRDGGPTG